MFTLVPDENSMEDPLCNSSFGSMVSLDYVTPDTEDVDGEKVTQAIANTTRRKGQSPGGDQGHKRKWKGMKKKKLRKSKDTAKAKDNVQEQEQEQAPTKGSQKRQGKKSKTKDQGKDKGKGKGTNQTSKPPWKESQPGGKGKGKGGQRKRITSAVNQRFTSLVQGATERDLCLLLDEGSWRNGGLHL